MGEEWRKEADERRRCDGGDACRKGERREKMTGETGRIPVFLFKKTNQKKNPVSSGCLLKPTVAEWL